MAIIVIFLIRDTKISQDTGKWKNHSIAETKVGEVVGYGNKMMKS